MLDECAPGYTYKIKEHNIWVTYKGKTYRTLSKGPHRKKINPEIQVGQIRGMINNLEIDMACAKRELEILN
ncbi:MAG: hypothetical protein J3T61_03125 [Candidatus Brocadiales bacterium]|nr:hypothetical protein [Candidatus Bathyanammoxibius sp.]